MAEADEDPGIEMWGDKDHLGIDARCTYHPKTRNFRVTATWKGHVLTREFPSSYEPKFGMDVQDQQDSFDIAEALALELERLAKSPKFGLANLTKQNRRLDQRV